jgi:YbgC/YbaW family acyl-CoA thioester hydrolase
MTKPQRADYRFFDRLRVRWAEVDMQKIVFNGHYLMYFDTAVAGYWRALAMPYHDTLAQLQGDLFVRKATLEYLGSARYDDLCEVGLRCARIGNSSLLFSAAMFRGEQLLVHGELVYVFADPASQTSRPVPQVLRNTLQAFEDGASMLDIRVVTWAELGADGRAQVQALRQSVFAEELQVDSGLLPDDDDDHALHALACNRFGAAVAAARLLPAQDGVAALGRMAVVAPLRGSGIGRAVLAALLAAARTRGDREVMLKAHAAAVGFYRRAGFDADGAPFQAAGQPHQSMRLPLPRAQAASLGNS